MAPNYANSKVYCLRQSNDNDRIVYIGSTTRTLSERMAEHRRCTITRPKSKIHNHMRDVGVDHFYIELLTDFPCDRKEQLHAEEGRHIRLHKDELLNSNIAGRSLSEYMHDYLQKQETKEHRHNYYLEHKTEFRESSNTWRQNHKDDTEYKERAKRLSKEYNLRMKDDPAFKAKRHQYYLRKKAERDAVLSAAAVTPANVQ